MIAAERSELPPTACSGCGGAKNAPIACSAGPTIEFGFAGDVCTAELAGAKLRAERLDDEHADLRLHDATGKVLASVVVSKLWDDESITVSVMNIGSALLWSHARWLEAQAGGQPVLEVGQRQCGAREPRSL